jgi:signal transduction histidine kinase
MITERTAACWVRLYFAVNIKPMETPMSRQLQLVLLWIFLQAAAFGWLSSARLDQIQQRFEQDSRLGLRLLGEETSKLEALLDALVSAQAPQRSGDSLYPLFQRLSMHYPALFDLADFRPGRGWRLGSGAPEPAGLERARQQSILLGHAVMTPLNGMSHSYWLVLAHDEQAAFALKVAPLLLVPGKEWPLGLQQVHLRSGLSDLALITPAPAYHMVPFRFVFAARVASRSQPFVLQAETQFGQERLPWAPILSLALASALILWGLNAFLEQRATVLRARRQAHLAQSARLNTLGEMAAGMAHEINQPLTAILANCQASLRLLNEEEAELELVRESIDIAASQAKRAAAIIQRLRDGLENTPSATPLQPLALAEMVDEVLFVLEPDCQARSVRVRFVRRDDSVMVRVDRIAIEQVIHNLLTNALEALRETPPKRRLIELAVQARGDQALLTVSDRGPGIPPELLPRLFEPFFTTRKAGMGLGLSICETLVGQFGGEIGAENRATGGARFTIVLPRVEIV